MPRAPAEKGKVPPRPVIAVTSGEPAGIGPDICLVLGDRFPQARIVLLGDRQLFADRARALGMELHLQEYRADVAPRAGVLELLPIPLPRSCMAGRLDRANAPYVLELLRRALAGCREGEFSAMVTAPVNKAVINDAGIAFTGHTEFLDQACGSSGVVMMLVGGGLRVALATTHLPLARVPEAITTPALERSLRILVEGLQLNFGIARPRILVAALNPHSGEGGHLGREEIEVISPLLARLRAEGMRLEGPLPADTLFVPARLAGADCALAMYHDQGLPVLKYASFGAGVNVTLGLPVVRTSVDHGTALDLAGSGRADAGSLVAALQLAIDMACCRQAAVPSMPAGAS